MLTTIEAEIDVNGKVTFLEPLKISKKSRAIITLLEDAKIIDQPKQENGGVKVEDNINARQLEWLKAHRDDYAGKYVALDGDILVAHGETLQEVREQTQGAKNLFITKVFAEETIVSAGL
ncbi:MAG TPA: DUF5678 domain-containing protein [Pyrinomonadaceae bacterium]|nr:DUF5678 domain-containing protein [Pyrinomonadaceae bacterium]